MPSDEPRTTALWVAAREGTAALACPLDRPEGQQHGQEGSSNGSGSGDISNNSSSTTLVEAGEAVGGNDSAGGVGPAAVTVDLGPGPGAAPPPPAAGAAEPFYVGAAAESTISMQSMDVDDLEGILGGQGVGVVGLGPGEGQEGGAGLGQEGRQRDDDDEEERCALTEMVLEQAGEGEQRQALVLQQLQQLQEQQEREERERLEREQQQQQELEQQRQQQEQQGAEEEGARAALEWGTGSNEGVRGTVSGAGADGGVLQAQFKGVADGGSGAGTPLAGLPLPGSPLATGSWWDRRGPREQGADADTNADAR